MRFADRRARFLTRRRRHFQLVYNRPSQRRLQQLRVACCFASNGCDWSGELHALKVGFHIRRWASARLDSRSRLLARRRSLSARLRPRIGGARRGSPFDERMFAAIDRLRTMRRADRGGNRRRSRTLVPDDADRVPKSLRHRRNAARKGERAVRNSPFCAAQMADHLASCPRGRSACVFDGCNWKGGDRERLQQHLKSAYVSHLSLLATKMAEMRAALDAAIIAQEAAARRIDLLEDRV